jgi:nucleoid DNA-binding protein
MSDSILSLLADELDVPPKQAKKLLVAMLREVKKRARREGVRLPEFGTFRESNGKITFEPSPSLARAVNHRFEGLQSEDLATAPNTEEEDDQDDEGPSTITLGYQDSDWSPLDDKAKGTGETEDTGEAEEDEPDTEEFEVPSADDTPDAEESEPSDAATSEVDEEEPAAEEPAEPPSSQTEELYPFVENGPDGEEESETAAEQQEEVVDEEHDSLSDIWESDEDESEPASSSAGEAEPAEPFSPSSDMETTDEPDSEPHPATNPSPAQDAPTSEVDIDPSVQEPAASEGEAGSDDGRSTGVRVLAGVLVVLLLGGAAWYVLGQQGTVQPPRATFAQLRAQIQPQENNRSTSDSPPVGTSSQESASTTAATESNSTASSKPDPETQGNDAVDPPTASATTQTESASSEDAGTADPADQAASTTQANASRTINEAEGGWTVIVGSRTNRNAAQSLVEKYRTAFTDQTLPVDVVTGTVENTTRYRVGVGQFDSRADAESFVDRANQKLPKGAWPLRL